MTGVHVLRILVSLGLLVTSCAQAVAAEGPVDRAELESFLDGVVQLQLRSAPAAGAAIAVVKDGEIFFTKGYGLANVERNLPVDPQHTLFRAGSVSKLLTWTAVMQLVEQGKLDLDTDVNRYLTDFKIPATFPEPVTLRNLMTHTAGFEDGMIGYIFAPTAEDLTTLGAALAAHVPARIRPPTRDFENGTDCVYSNWGAALAGYIVQTVAGMPFDEYVERHIFAPLGMDSSTFREPLPRELSERLSGGYMRQDGAFVPRQFEYSHDFAPAGSLSNTVTDMARFMIAHLQPASVNDGRLLSPETLQLMHSHALGPGDSLNGMTLGFFENWMNGRRVLGHGGAGLAFHSQLLLVPDSDLGLFIAYNTAEASDAGSELVQAFMDHYFPAELAALEVRNHATTRNVRYEGTYRTLRRSYTKLDKLIAGGGDVVVRAMPDGTLLFNAVDGRPARWIEQRDGVFRQAARDSWSVFKQADGGEMRLVRSFVAEPLERISLLESFSLHSFILVTASLLFVSTLISAVRQRQRDPELSPPLRWARPVLALGGASLLSFLVCIVVTLLTLDDFVADLISRPPTGLYISLTFALGAIPAVAASVVFAVMVWKRALWSVGARLHYTAAVVAAVAVIAILQYWNLIGYRFG